jgi:hypothetical protein
MIMLHFNRLNDSSGKNYLLSFNFKKVPLAFQLCQPIWCADLSTSDEHRALLAGLHPSSHRQLTWQ